MGRLFRSRSIKYALAVVLILLSVIALSSWRWHSGFVLYIPQGNSDIRSTICVTDGQLILEIIFRDKPNFAGSEIDREREVFAPGVAEFAVVHGLMGHSHRMTSNGSMALYPGRYLTIHRRAEMNWLADYIRSEPMTTSPLGWNARTVQHYVSLNAVVVLILLTMPVVLVCKPWKRAGVGSCQDCGYSLRGLSGTTCPECGAERG